MENKQKSLRVSEVTIDRVLSHYLWNTAMLPKKEDMLTAVTSTERKPIHIDATDYMQNGANQYAVLELLTSKKVV
ncbi:MULTISPECIES: hypothetical protein [Neisseriaceae]|uniref:Transposase n=2 Tax=Morococcus cerebrosus TaxID=1056807 RepID=A0ABY3YDA8_9NEIS|nr:MULTISPECIES: hypothetical protein [Neisseriaceae]UNV87296.1 hypothetical protein MON37_11775 [Morococcus cerebrosus]